LILLEECLLLAQSRHSAEYKNGQIISVEIGNYQF